MKVVEKANKFFESQPELEVLFLFDPDEDYREEIAEIEPNSIEVLTVGPMEGIRAKYIIETQSEEKNILVYCPFRKPTGEMSEQFHLMDLVYANRVLSMDPVSDLMEEYKLPQDQYELISSYYKKGLRYKKDRRPLRKILNPALTERKLRVGLAQRILGVTTVSASPTMDGTIAKLLITATDGDVLENKIEELAKLDLASFLGNELSRLFALDAPALNRQNVITAAQKLKYNLLVGPMNNPADQDPYQQLRIDVQHIYSRLSRFKLEWERNTKLKKPLEEVLRNLAKEASEERLIEVYGADAKYGLPTRKVIASVIKQLVPLVSSQPKKVLETLDNYQNELKDQESPIAFTVLTLWHMAVFHNELKNHPVHELDTPSEYIEAYQEHYYEIDQQYRKAVTFYNQINNSELTESTGLDAVFEEFLTFYQSEFVQKLNIGWQQWLSDIGFDFGKLNITKQSDFFAKYVESSNIKTAVIISDAFRFEAAQELLKVFKRDVQKVLNMEPMLASVPSHTGLGMANLLPFEKLSLQDGNYLADGNKTGSTPEREKILQNKDPEATYISATKVSGMNRSQVRELFKEFSTVYIKHNLIDSAGEQHATEKKVFNHVDQTIEYLNDLVRSLVSDANVYRFLVTADHGFNYMENKLDDATLEEFPDVKGKVKSDPRFVVAEEISDNFEGYQFPISATSKIEQDLQVGLPRAVNRFKHRGAGYHYVHGGASLQEVIVPVIEANKKRKEKGKKVDVKLVSNEHVITTGSAQVEILQLQSVSDKRNPRTIKIGFYNDEKQLVSDEQTIVFEATSSDATLRKKKILLTLTPAANDLNHCTLMGFNEEEHNKLNPVINQRYTIRRLMGQDEF